MKALEQCCATHFQVDASSSLGGHPQLHAPLSRFNPSLPLLNPPAASGSLQLPGDSKDALEGMQLRLLIPSILRRMTSGIERTLTWKTMQICMRALFQIGMFWPRNSLWRLRDLVSLSMPYCILCDSLGVLCSGGFSISDHDLNILCLFAWKIDNNLTTLAFNKMSYVFLQAGMENLEKT